MIHLLKDTYMLITDKTISINKADKKANYMLLMMSS